MKKVQNPLDWLGTTKWPPLYNFDTTKWPPFYIGRNIWLPWSQIKSNTTHRCYRDCTWLYTTCAWRQVGSDSTPHSSMIDNLMCPRRPYTNWSLVNKVTQGRLVTVAALPLCSQNKCTTKKTVNLEKVNLNKTLKWCSIVKSWKWSDPWKSLHQKKTLFTRELQNLTEVFKTFNQESESIISSQRETRVKHENFTICFSFASDWLRGQREFFFDQSHNVT